MLVIGSYEVSAHPFRISKSKRVLHRHVEALPPSDGALAIRSIHNLTDVQAEQEEPANCVLRFSLALLPVVPVQLCYLNSMGVTLAFRIFEDPINQICAILVAEECNH